MILFYLIMGMSCSSREYVGDYVECICKMLNREWCGIFAFLFKASVMVPKNAKSNLKTKRINIFSRKEFINKKANA